MVGNTDRVRLVTVPNLFGVPTEAMRDGQTVTQAVVQQQSQGDQLKIKHDRDIEAIAVDLFTQRKFHWGRVTMKDGTQRYVLTVGDGLVIVKPHVAEAGGELFDVVHQPRGTKDEKPIAVGLDLGYAQGAAEDFARKMGAEILLNKEATWRKKPVSPKQVAALARWKVPADTIAALKTAGEASDLLTETIARRKAA
jgi:hypothetical protein